MSDTPMSVATDTQLLDELQRLVIVCDKVELSDMSWTATIIHGAGDEFGRGKDVRAALTDSLNVRDEAYNGLRAVDPVKFAHLPRPWNETVATIATEIEELRSALVWWQGDKFTAVRSVNDPLPYEASLTQRLPNEHLADCVLRAYRSSQSPLVPSEETPK